MAEADRHLNSAIAIALATADHPCWFSIPLSSNSNRSLEADNRERSPFQVLVHGRSGGRRQTGGCRVAARMTASSRPFSAW